MPFCKLHLKGRRPPDFPIVYAREPKSLGEHLRKERLLRGLRQRDLAVILGVNQFTLLNWEKGHTRPLARHYAAVIKFLGSDPVATPPSISGRLLSVRRRLGLTQAEFAEKVGLDEGSVCRWEAGSRRPSRWMTARVEAILDALESGREVTGLGFYDLTRWRRAVPPGVRPKAIGERIRAARLKAGLSQEELGRRLLVSRTTVQWWEKGKAVPAEVRKSLNWLLGGTGKKPA